MNNVENKKRRHGSYFLSLGILVLFTILLFNTKKVAEFAVYGGKTAFISVLPSTFPYLVLSSLLVKNGAARALGKGLSFISRLFLLPPPCSSVIIIGLISGFPVGASMAWELYRSGECSFKDCRCLTAFCSFCGPPFILGVFGMGLMNDLRAGVVLYAIQTVISLLGGVIICRSAKKECDDITSCDDKTPNDAKSFSEIFCSSVTSAGLSMLFIFAYVIFFSVLSGVITGFLPDSGIVKTVITGLLEMSSGVSCVKNHIDGEILKYIFGSGIILFSGISVMLQVSSVSGGKIPLKGYIILKAVSVIIGSGLSAFIYFWFLK